ncbi:MAG: adenylate/guanylate cyclase domain-containing protein [Minwuia sp.]|nr:adenylate/guanylate cyclase domain-containing protein [Minwuia sp.]
MAAISGPIYGLIFVADLPDSPLATLALYGAINGGLVWGGLLLLWPSRLCAPLRRLAFPWHVLFLVGLTAVSIPLSASISGSIQSGQLLLLPGFGTGWSLYPYILLIVALVLTCIQIAKMIGPRILGNMLIGRYNNPVEEHRIFLFIDLIDSTALTRQLGDLGAQRLLTRFFFDMGQPVAESGGEIHAYVGDEAIITWPFRAGADQSRCVRCFYAVQDVLDANAEAYEKLFGVRPQIRAGLHGGPVIVSECGDTKRSIVYFGDTMNTAARLESEAKNLKKDLIISAALLQDLNLPDDIVAESLPEVTLRGHDSPTRFFALARSGSARGTGLKVGEA